jgi:hypothetical protein
MLTSRKIARPQKDEPNENSDEYSEYDKYNRSRGVKAPPLFA